MATNTEWSLLAHVLKNQQFLWDGRGTFITQDQFLDQSFLNWLILKLFVYKLFLWSGKSVWKSNWLEVSHIFFITSFCQLIIFSQPRNKFQTIFFNKFIKVLSKIWIFNLILRFSIMLYELLTKIMRSWKFENLGLQMFLIMFQRFQVKSSQYEPFHDLQC